MSGKDNQDCDFDVYAYHTRILLTRQYPPMASSNVKICEIIANTWNLHSLGSKDTSKYF